MFGTHIEEEGESDGIPWHLKWGAANEWIGKIGAVGGDESEVKIKLPPAVQLGKANRKLLQGQLHSSANTYHRSEGGGLLLVLAHHTLSVYVQ